MPNKPPVALLDACVLYPYTLRDTLMHFALVDLYRPRWSERIQQEWMLNLLETRENTYTREKLQRTIDLMNAAFELACIEESQYSKFVPTLNIPDQNDRHVLAAAVAAGADFLVTFNLRDFPSAVVATHGVVAVSPDDFLLDIARQNSKEAISALRNQSLCMKKWPKTPEEIAKTLSKIGLEKTSAFLLKALG